MQVLLLILMLLNKAAHGVWCGRCILILMMEVFQEIVFGLDIHECLLAAAILFGQIVSSLSCPHAPLCGAAHWRGMLTLKDCCCLWHPQGVCCLGCCNWLHVVDVVQGILRLVLLAEALQSVRCDDAIRNACIILLVSMQLA